MKYRIVHFIRRRRNVSYRRLHLVTINCNPFLLRYVTILTHEVAEIKFDTNCFITNKYKYYEQIRAENKIITKGKMS